MQKFDHIVVGTGQAAGILLGKIIPTGDSIAVIEGGKVGGSCVNYGCTPTKTMVATAKAFHTAGKGDAFGFETSDLKLDFTRVMNRMNGIRSASSDGLTQWMESSENVTLFRDWASFSKNYTLRVGDRKIFGKRIYINTGTRNVVPSVEGIEDVPWMDSAGLLDLDRLPEHLLILGGGYVGMEFAQIYHRLGARVTVIQRASHVMPREDADVSDAIREILEGEGVEILCNATATATRYCDKVLTLTYTSGGAERSVRGSHLLVAAGRRPNSDTLGLEHTDIRIDGHGYIQVDDYCRTSAEGIFALGDVNGEGAYTHTSVHDGEIVLAHLYGGHKRISRRIPIYALFTDPPLGRVGLTEHDARGRGYRILKATMPMSKINRAKEMGETRGFAKLIVDAENDYILGASILGPGGDEIINMLASIMHSRIPCRRYREVVLVHPTVSELMPFVLDGLKEVE